MTLDIAATVAAIEANPLGRIMHGQRELFHSNVLAWFFDAFPGPADEVFGRWMPADATVGGAREVERERQHLDLVLHLPGYRPLVIENKVFSLPHVAQLEAYDQVVAAWPHVPSRILLTMTPADFPLPPAWREVLWRDLADAIDDALPRDVGYETETMRRYVQLVRDLDALVAITDITPDRLGESVFLTPETLGRIPSSQLQAALQKARAQRVAAWLATMLPVQSALPAALAASPVSGRYGIHWGLTNTQPLVDWFTLVHTDDGPLLAGWQYQHGNFRRAIILLDEHLHGGSPKARQAREAIAARHPELFAFPPGIGSSHSGRKAFNHYAPAFVYQYVKAPALSLGHLLHAAQDVRTHLEGTLTI